MSKTAEEEHKDPLTLFIPLKSDQVAASSSEDDARAGNETRGFPRAWDRYFSHSTRRARGDADLSSVACQGRNPSPSKRPRVLETIEESGDSSDPDNLWAPKHVPQTPIVKECKQSEEPAEAVTASAEAEDHRGIPSLYNGSDSFEKRVELLRSKVAEFCGEQLNDKSLTVDAQLFVDLDFTARFRTQLQRAVNAEVTKARKRKSARRRRHRKRDDERSDNEGEDETPTPPQPL
jgi:hypothetical protein